MRARVTCLKRYDNLFNVKYKVTYVQQCYTLFQWTHTRVIFHLYANKT